MSLGEGHKAGVAAGQRETAKAALEVLKAGGNAFDAAIAGFLAACVAEPVLSSLGGGGFLVAKPADGDVSVFDFFTETPLNRPLRNDVDFHPVTADFGVAQQEFHIGMGAVATPGAVAGIFEIHNALGRMPMAELISPARMLARDGIRLNRFQAYLLGVVGPIYQTSAGSRAMFCRSGGDELLSAGDYYRPEAFAGFLDAMASEGPDLFYLGDVASRITAMDGCVLSREDLAKYRVVRRHPLHTRIGNHEIFLNPPPAIGGALIDYALRCLRLSQLRPGDFGSEKHATALIHAMDTANRARFDCGIDRDANAGAQALAGMDPHPPSYRGTTHISIADADGNLAALTVSNGEGCGHVVPDTGIMLNNMLGEDDLNAAGFFEWPEGVRLSSMMTPGVMVDPDGAWTAFGSGGSNRIRSALTQVILNICVYESNLAEALSRPRLHLEGNKLSVEPGFEHTPSWPGEVHIWPEANMFFGGVHVMQCDAAGGVQGAGDPRRDGISLGF